MNIRDAYSDIVDKEGLLPDAAQLRIVEALQHLQSELEAGVSGWRSLLAKTGMGPARNPVRGMYLWGGVGRGKTFLMDLFYENLKVTDKRRIHFHRIMREVHQRMKRLGDTEDPLDKVAAEIASETRVLCFDEFFVSDIADAMIRRGRHRYRGVSASRGLLRREGRCVRELLALATVEVRGARPSG